MKLSRTGCAAVPWGQELGLFARSLSPLTFVVRTRLSEQTYIVQMASRPSTYPEQSSRPPTSRPWTSRSTGRPFTAQSRPATAARPHTAVSSRHEASYVVAVIEGRGMGRDVGIAALDRDTGRLQLIQVVSLHSYVRRQLTQGHLWALARGLSNLC